MNLIMRNATRSILQEDGVKKSNYFLLEEELISIRIYPISTLFKSNFTAQIVTLELPISSITSKWTHQHISISTVIPTRMKLSHERMRLRNMCYVSIFLPEIELQHEWSISFHTPLRAYINYVKTLNFTPRCYEYS